MTCELCFELIDLCKYKEHFREEAMSIDEFCTSCSVTHKKNDPKYVSDCNRYIKQCKFGCNFYSTPLKLEDHYATTC